MKIQKKERTKGNLMQNENYIHKEKKSIKSNNFELNNNNEIRKISLPIRKNCFNSPKRKKLIINKTDSFQSNNSTYFTNKTEQNIFFSFGKIKPQNKNVNINSKQNKLTPKFKKNNVLTEKNVNNENISLNIDESNKKYMKKNIIPKPNIKKNCLNSITNLEKIDYSKNHNENIFIKSNYKILTETSTAFYNCDKRKEERDLKVIEEFMGNFKNKERGESLKNALNMYKRYKSLANLNFGNKLNNSCCDLNSIKNKLTEHKSEENLLANKKIIKQKINNKKNNTNQNKSNINNYNLKNNFISYQSINKNNNYDKKVKKFFLRKIIREEKCYRDDKGNIHVVDFKQSLINEENNPISNDHNKIIQKDLSHENYQVKKIQNKNNINNPNNDKIRNSEYNKNRNKLRIINISKRVESKKEYQNKTNHFIQPQKIKIVKYKNKSNNDSNNFVNNFRIKKIPLNRIDIINIGPIHRNHSYQNLCHFNENKYNRNNEYYNNNINYKYAHNTNYDLSRYKKIRYIDNYNSYNNNYNDFIGDCYKKESYPEPYRTFLINRNDKNCYFYESKPLSKERQKILRHNNSYIVLKRNEDHFMNYIRDEYYNTNSHNYYNENININNNIANDNTRYNNGCINYYESVRIPFYNHRNSN